MTHRISLFTILFTLVASLSAQPQVDSLRRVISRQGTTAHLLAEMARAYSTSQPDSALHYADLAARRKAAGADLITLEAARGDALVAQGQTKQAIGHYAKALATARQLKDADEEHNQLCSMGICHSRLQEFDKAAKCYDRVIAYGVKHSRQLAFSGYQNYGAMCSRMGRVDDTKTMLMNALKYEDAAQPALRVSVYAGLGTILTYDPQTFPEAERYLRKGIDIARQAREPLAEASCLSPLITLLTQLPARYDEIPALIARTDGIVKDLAPDGVERMQLEHAKANF